MVLFLKCEIQINIQYYEFSGLFPSRNKLPRLLQGIIMNKTHDIKIIINVQLKTENKLFDSPTVMSLRVGANQRASYCWHHSDVILGKCSCTNRNYREIKGNLAKLCIYNKLNIMSFIHDYALKEYGLFLEGQSPENSWYCLFILSFYSK